MSDTPRTDALHETFAPHDLDAVEEISPCYEAMIDLARELERKLMTQQEDKASASDVRKEAVPETTADAHADIPLIASEALFGFCAWLTCRKKLTKMGWMEDCAPIPPLIDAFCLANNLQPPREGWHKVLRHPTDAAAVPDEATTPSKPDEAPSE